MPGAQPVPQPVTVVEPAAPAPAPARDVAINLDTVLRLAEQQNAQVGAGMMGRPLAGDGQGFRIAVNTMGRLADADELGNVVLEAAELARALAGEDVGTIIYKD